MMIKQKILRGLLLLCLLLVPLFFTAIEASEIGDLSPRINVSIVGMVKRPGVYRVYPSTRLSEAIDMARVRTQNVQNAFQDTLLVGHVELDVKTYLANSLLRNVILRRGMREERIDLAKFYVSGDSKNNPFVREGDVIVIPPIKGHVFIEGALNKPGTFEFVAGDRLTDIIELAMGLKRDAYLAKVEVIRFIDKEKTKQVFINLKKALQNPQSKDNLVLEPDDRIFIKYIPEYRITKTISIYLYGAVKKPGKFKVIEGYRVYDAIRLADGFRNSADFSKIELASLDRKTNETRIDSIDIGKIINNPESEENVYLTDGDRLYFRSVPDYADYNFVQIQGEVIYPGYYPIKEGETTLLGLIKQCGGMKESADVCNAFIQRRTREDVIDKEFERLKLISKGEMNDLEYAYFKTKSREIRGKFSVNLAKLIRENKLEHDIILKSNDYVYVPDNSATIRVSGQVKLPGLIVYEANKTFSYYIEKAGGYSWNARTGKARIIKSSTGEWIDPDNDTIIENGDMLFIPEHQDRDWWQTSQDLIKFIASTVTIVAVIHTLSK